MAAEHYHPPASLVVFSDDWGRHPSSCQHLVRQLLPQQKTLWVNTIGTRAPRLDIATIRRVVEKLKQWKSDDSASDALSERNGHHNLTVLNPRMWPWFSRPHDRRINAWALSRQLTPMIHELPKPVTAITTLPITADLPGVLPVDKWVYYCVDDFAEWPGLDGDTLRLMDRKMVRKADEIVAVSDHLQRMIHKCGRDSSLLTHGVDLEHWSPEEPEAASSAEAVRQSLRVRSDGPLIVFWGVVDRRLDSEMLKALSKTTDGTICLVGPQQDPDEQILNLPNVQAPGPVSFSELPRIAQAADVLIMPYADLPVTRAMQPLKMKEYLATGRPVIVSPLPAVHNWADCMDVATTPDQFVERVLARTDGRLPSEQLSARQRLTAESWSAKAVQFSRHLNTTAITESSGCLT